MKKTILLTTITIISAMTINTSNAQYSKGGSDFNRTKNVISSDSHKDDYHDSRYAKDDNKFFYISRVKDNRKEQLYSYNRFEKHEEVARFKDEDRSRKDQYSVRYDDHKDRH